MSALNTSQSESQAVWLLLITCWSHEDQIRLPRRHRRHLQVGSSFSLFFFALLFVTTNKSFGQSFFSLASARPSFCYDVVFLVVVCVCCLNLRFYILYPFSVSPSIADLAQKKMWECYSVAVMIFFCSLMFLFLLTTYLLLHVWLRSLFWQYANRSWRNCSGLIE